MRTILLLSIIYYLLSIISIVTIGTIVTIPSIPSITPQNLSVYAHFKGFYE